MKEENKIGIQYKDLPNYISVQCLWIFPPQTSLIYIQDYLGCIYGDVKNEWQLLSEAHQHPASLCTPCAMCC